MRFARYLAAATIAFASLPLLVAQQVDATAQQNASASAAGVHASQSGNADANANVNHGRADANGSASANGSAIAPDAASHGAASGAGTASANMRQVTGQLENKLDSKTARAGDQVVLKTNQKIKTADGMVIPKGSRLIGHVTEVQAHSKQQAESHMGLEFDRAELRGGQSMAIHSIIESVQPSPAAMAAASMAEDDAFDAPMGGGAVASGGGRGGIGGGLGGGGLVGGAAGGAAMATSHVGSELGSTTGSAMRATSGLGANAAGNLGHGVNAAANGAGFLGAHATGIRGVMLNGDAAGSASGMLTAANRNIHLDSGTQMVLGIAAAR